jgi:hypothetical protein
MSRGKYLFRQTEAERLFRAAKSAGFTPTAIKVNPQGELKLEFGESAAQDSVSDLEQWRKNRNARSAKGD